MNNLCASIAISGAVLCYSAQCADFPQPTLGKNELILFDANGDYANETDRTVSTTNLHDVKGEVWFKAECDHVDQNFYQLQSKDGKTNVNFNLRVGSSNDNKGRAVHNSIDTYIQKQAGEQLWFRIDLDKDCQKDIKDHHPGVEFSAHITITITRVFS